jgi:hypothetical protein
MVQLTKNRKKSKNQTKLKKSNNKTMKGGVKFFTIPGSLLPIPAASAGSLAGTVAGGLGILAAGYAINRLNRNSRFNRPMKTKHDTTWKQFIIYLCEKYHLSRRTKSELDDVPKYNNKVIEEIIKSRGSEDSDIEVQNINVDKLYSSFLKIQMMKIRRSHLRSRENSRA